MAAKGPFRKTSGHCHLIDQKIKKWRMCITLYHLNHWHRAIVRKISVTFDISEDMHHRLRHRHYQSHTKTKKSGMPGHHSHRTIYWHHPYRKPLILKGIQYRIGKYVENRFRKL